MRRSGFTTRSKTIPRNPSPTRCSSTLTSDTEASPALPSPARGGSAPREIGVKASEEFLGQRDDDARRASHVAESVLVLVLGHLADEFGAVGAQASDSVVDAFDCKHDAPEAQRVRRCDRRFDLDQFWIAKLRSSPAIAGATIYFGRWDAYLDAVDTATGREKWRFKTGYRILSSPAVVEGTIYFGSMDGIFYAVDTKSGQERWRFKTNERLRSSPAIQNQTVYFGGDDGQVYALDAETGQEQWRVKTRGPIISSASITYGIAYFGCADGHLYAVNVRTGKRKWKFNAPFGWMRSSPAVASGMIYFGSDDGNLYALH